DRRPAPSGPAARRPRWAVAAVAAAAVAVLGAGIVSLRAWLDRGPGPRPAVRIDDPATRGAMPASRLVPTWLPAGLPLAGRPLEPRGTPSVGVQASLWTRDHHDAALVAAVIQAPAGTTVSAATVDQTAAGIAGLFGERPADAAFTARRGDRGSRGARRGRAAADQPRAPGVPRD